MVCPACQGRGESHGIMCGPAGCRTGALRCHTCKGTGEITEDHAARIKLAKRMRRERVDSRRVTLREEASRLGCDLGEWSRIEDGGEPETEAGGLAWNT